MATEADYYVPEKPNDVAGRMFVIVLPDSLTPLASCMDRDVAVRIAQLVNLCGLVPSDDD